MESQIRTRGSTKIEKEKSPETIFKKGKYVMVKWRNNVDYLAQVLDCRKNLEGDLQFHIVFIWDDIAEWHSASNLKLATDEQVKEILEEIKQIKAAAKDSHKKSSVESQSLADEHDMIYDPNHTQFQEACRKRRERQRRSLSSEVDPAQNEVQTQKSPIQSDSPVASSSRQTPIRRPPTVTKPLATLIANKKPAASAKPVVPLEDQLFSVPGAKAPPQSFQCQYCPRTLRKQDLLESHIYHYHSDKIKSDPPHAEVLSSASKKRKQEPESAPEMQSIPEGNLKDCLMYCKACKTSGSVTEPEANIIQCRVCRVWSHRKCTECFDESSWVCTFCRREPSASGLTDWTNALENFRASEPIRPEDINLEEISEEIDGLLQWLRKLKMLVNSGRRNVLRIKRHNAGNGGNIAGNVQLLQNRSVDSELSIDLLCSGSHTEEQFGTLDSPDISRLLANIPTNLPDLTITDDLLNVVQPSSSQLQNSVSSSNAASNVSSAFDTPTKNLINSLFQSMTPVEGGNSTSPTAGSTGTVIATPPTATAIEADLQKAVPMDTTTLMTSSNNASPYFATPVKTTSRRAANSGASAGEIEAAASLIGLSETSTSGGIAGRNAPYTPSSQDLEYLNREVLIPLEEMIDLIESRLEFLDGKIEEALGDDDGDSGSGSQESMPLSPPQGGLTYPPPRFVPARRRHPNGHPQARRRH